MSGTEKTVRTGKVKAVIGVRIDPPVKAKLRRMAKQQRRSLSQYIAVVLEAHAQAHQQEAK